MLARHAVWGAVAAVVMSSAAAPACEGLRDGPKGTVTEIVDGDTLLLDTGLVVRLIGIQAPKLALGRDGYDDWPKGNEAKAALIAADEEAKKQGRGSFALDGKMVDIPIIERAQRLLRRYDAIKAREARTRAAMRG